MDALPLSAQARKVSPMLIEVLSPSLAPLAILPCWTAWHFFNRASDINRGDPASKWLHVGIAARKRLLSSRGGRGFNSFRRSCPATAPILMRRFFLRAETFDFFQKKSSFSNARQQIPSTKQGRSVGQPRISSIYFPTGFGRSLSKNCREIPGGRGAMTSKGAE